MKNKKRFSIILVAVIVGFVILISVGGYFGYKQIKSYQANQSNKEKQAQKLFKSQQEALDKANQEIEALKKEPVQPPTQQHIQQSSQSNQDSMVKIELCKAEAETKLDTKKQEFDVIIEAHRSINIALIADQTKPFHTHDPAKIMELLETWDNMERQKQTTQLNTFYLQYYNECLQK